MHSLSAASGAATAVTGAGGGAMLTLAGVVLVQLIKSWFRAKRAAPGEALMSTADRNAAITGMNVSLKGVTADNERLQKRVEDLFHENARQRDEIAELRSRVSALEARLRHYEEVG
ncbi:MAG: hypothetical protein ACRDMV_18165 [Streptosporangiales bacterium]